MAAGRDRGATIAGALALLFGLFVMASALLDPSFLSEGVPRWIGVSAGAVFFLTGLVVLRSATGGGAAVDLVNTILVAVLVTAFAAVSMVFPPGALFVVYFAVLCWIAVYRQIHTRVTGRDPLAGVSDARHLGLGCAVTIVLILVVVLAVWLMKDPAPAVPLLPERMPG
jgi:hypothetical protein